MAEMVAAQAQLDGSGSVASQAELDRWEEEARRSVLLRWALARLTDSKGQHDKA